MGVAATSSCMSLAHKPQVRLHVVDVRDGAKASSGARATSLRSGDEIRLHCLSRLPADNPLRNKWSALPRTLVIRMNKLDSGDNSIGVRLSDKREVTAVQSPVATEAGWQVGDVVVAVGLELVHTQGDLVRAILASKVKLQLDSKPMTFLVQRPAPHPRRGIQDGVVPGGEGPKKQLLGTSVPQEFWRAQILHSSDHKLWNLLPGGWCLLQLASSPDHRTEGMAAQELDVCEEVAGFAGRFNTMLSSSPKVQLCLPVGASVSACSRADFAASGDVVLLHPYPAAEVEKFVCNASQASLECELAHEFFHYCAWVSGGSKLAWDLQGQRQPDGGVLLVAPSMMKAADVSLGNLLEAALPPLQNQASKDWLVQHFKAAHPKCAPNCQHFDARRNAERSFGITRSCGRSCAS